MKFKTDNKITIRIMFGANPNAIRIIRNGKVYFIRHLGGKYSEVKVNITHPGNYTVQAFKGTITALKKGALEIAPFPDVPPKERDLEKPYRIVTNKSLTGTPARIFPHSGIIEVSTSWHKMIAPIRLFILLHEVGHFFYKTEWKCDQFAAHHFLKMGYNPSTAFYAISKILHKSPGNDTRVLTLLKNLIK